MHAFFFITILKGGIIPILLMSKLRPGNGRPLPKSCRLPLACDWEAWLVRVFPWRVGCMDLEGQHPGWWE